MQEQNSGSLGVPKNRDALPSLHSSFFLPADVNHLVEVLMDSLAHGGLSEITLNG